MACVLVVDDDRSIRELLRIVLEGEGHRVLVLPDGSTVIETLEASHEPLMVLMDLMMPHVSGWQVCAGMRDRSDLLSRHVVVVMTAAYGPETSCPEPAVSLLRKPFTIDAVIQLVAQYSPGQVASVPVAAADAPSASM